MSQLVKFNTAPTFRSMLDNFWGNAMFDDDVLKQNRMPAVNVKENEKDYEIELAAPGMKKEDFKIDVENGILIISAEKKEEKEEKEEKYTRREFSYSSFNRSFSLPQNVDENNIKARYENGVLYLTVPKQEEEKPKKKSISLT